MADHRPVRLGVAGIGGYARAVRERALSFGEQLDPPVKLAAVCDPQLERFADAAGQLRGQGVAVHDDYAAMLAGEIDAVWLPLPIHLHRPFTEQALAAGKAVMCEKPAAGTVDEVDAMIAARDRAGLAVLIGFQDVYAPDTTTLKQQVLDGALGEIRSATVCACWPRGSAYFSRSPWAGRQRVGDAWVLDSPANNAMAHFLNLALFLLGPTLATSATPESVHAELYRAADIENYDTCSLRVRLAGDRSLLVNYTHACEQHLGPIVTLHGTEATVQRTTRELRISRPGREDQVTPRDDQAMFPAMVQRFARAVRGREDPAIAAATLEVARQHTVIINGASEAATIVPLSSDVLTAITDAERGTLRCIPGIESTIAEITAAGQTLHESGRFAFTVPGAAADVRGYRHFAGPPQAAVLSCPGSSDAGDARR